MVTFVVIRHGLSQTNKERRFTGQLDIPLDNVGLLQAEYTGRYIAENFKIDKIYSSDLCRAYNTAKPVADAFGLDIIPRKELREADVGKWQGMLIDDIEKIYPEEYEFYKINPGKSSFGDGESYEDLMKRGAAAFKEMAEESDGKTVAVATHGGLIRALYCEWNNLPAESIKDVPIFPNASVTVIKYDNGKTEFVQLGYNEHLKNLK